jgi:hypothetical protein
MRRLLVILFLASSLLSACGANTFPVYSELTSLRVLALVADHPEVAVGDSVTITPWVSDSLGAGRVLTYTASACPDLGVAYGAEPTCVGNPLAQSAGNGTFNLLASTNYTSAATVLSTLTVPDILTGRSAQDRYNGVAYLVTYTVSAADGSQVKSFKRVIVSTRADKATNPTFNSIVANGTNIAAFPSSSVSLSSSYTATTSFSVLGSDGSILTESSSAITSWFTTAGTLHFDRTQLGTVNAFTAPSPLPAHAALIAVLRDGRGGIAVQALSF